MKQHVSRLEQRWAAGALLAAALFCALAVTNAGCRTNPVTGERELVLVSESQELAIGQRNHANIIFMYDGEYRDPELFGYLRAIVDRLHAVSHRPEMPAEFTVLNTSVVNAFATPGHVYATRGFLARLENEAQFAAVVGHELAHVAAGHTARNMTNALLTSLALSVADSAAGQSKTGRILVGAGQVSVTLLGLSYSREQERQADRVGTYYMALAGWHPRQAIAMQRLLAALDEDKETVIDRYLSTHPSASDRIAEIESVVAEKGLESPRYVQGDGVFAERWNQRLARLREVDKAFAPYDRGTEALQKGRYAEALAAAEEAIRSGANQAQFHRLKGDSLLLMGRISEALGSYNQSLRVDPQYVLANVGLGMACLEQKDYVGAEAQFLVATRSFPAGAAGWYGLGMARFFQERYADALGPLQTAASAMPDVPEVHYALAVCYERTGRPAEALQSYQQALQAGLSGPEAEHARQRVRSLQTAAPPSVRRMRRTP